MPYAAIFVLLLGNNKEMSFEYNKFIIKFDICRSWKNYRILSISCGTLIFYIKFARIMFHKNKDQCDISHQLLYICEIKVNSEYFYLHLS